MTAATRMSHGSSVVTTDATSFAAAVTAIQDAALNAVLDDEEDALELTFVS